MGVDDVRGPWGRRGRVSGCEGDVGEVLWVHGVWERGEYPR